MDDETSFGDWEDDTLFNFDDTSWTSYYDDGHKTKQRIQVSSKENKKSEQTDIDLDYAIALSLQDEFVDDVKENENTNPRKQEAIKPLSIVDEQWELIDPHPDVHALFVEYDEKYFYGKLKSVEVRWSRRMTLCAGICSYQGRGGLCSIGLSEPLLKLRPRRDLVETLLHEMIHAYLFVTQNNKDRDGHGPEFLSHMYRINRESGTNITVYHSFHAEVNIYKQHWWKCDGPCRNRSPYFGVVKRVMNRAPGPNDNWWAAHQQSCGGKFIKIKEPSNFGEKTTPKRKLKSDPKNKPSDIRKFIKSNSQKSSNNESSQLKDIESSVLCIDKSNSLKEDSSGVINETDILKKKNFIPFQGTGNKLGTSSRTSQVSSSISNINLKDLNFKTDFPSTLSRNTESIGTSIHSSLIEKVTSSVVKIPSKDNLHSFPTFKASTKKKLFSNSPKKTVTLNDFYSSLSGKIPTEKDFSEKLLSPAESLQISKISNANQAHDLQSGRVLVSSKSTSNRYEKSDIKKDLSPPNYIQESCVTGTNISNSISSKLYCPVCSNLVNEEINAHLDKCLKSQH